MTVIRVKFLLSIAMSFAAISLATPASAKNAMCSVHSADGTYNGPCSYSVQRGGTFTIKSLERRYILPRTSAITVAVDEYGYAKVKAVMASGVDSPWGDARRSKSDRSCWLGEDFWVCAY